MKRFYLMLLALFAFSSSVLVGTASAASTDPIIINGHKFVDLGLPSGLLWAETNVGASSATDDGDYFAWGETTPKAEYMPYNYNSSSSLDAATANWGGICRTPKPSEFEELYSQCDWKWNSNYQGASGYVVTGPNGNSLFLPASGYCYHTNLTNHGEFALYASSLSSSQSDAYYLTFSSEYVYTSMTNLRYQGCTVRPVAENENKPDVPDTPDVPENPDTPDVPDTPENPDDTGTSSDTLSINGYKFIDLGLPSGLFWAETNIGATSSTKDGDYLAWAEVESKLNYSWPTYKWGKNPSKYNEADGLTTLDPEDDAATVRWSTLCRIPSSAEMQELCEECDWAWQSNYQGASGYLVTGPNGKAIFLPASGYRCYNKENLVNHGSNGYYWTSSSLLRSDYYAYSLNFGNDYVYPLFSLFRYNGFPVRAVANKEATGITTIESNSNVKEIQRYDISGRVISSPQKGINIIRYSDGTTKKVIIK